MKHTLKEFPYPENVINPFHATDTAWKVSKYGVISGPYFSAFGLNTERYFVSLRIQSKSGKIRTRKNSVFAHVSHSVISFYILWKHQRFSNVFMGYQKRSVAWNRLIRRFLMKFSKDQSLPLQYESKCMFFVTTFCNNIDIRIWYKIVERYNSFCNMI